MKIDFDPAKNAKNIRERGLPFTLAAEFDWTTAMIVPSSATAKPLFRARLYREPPSCCGLHQIRCDGAGYQPARARKTEIKRYEEKA